MVEVNEAQNTEVFSSFNEITKMGHEQVVYCYDEPTGLKAIIAIHNTVLGPALGGTRMWSYASDQEALIDVLRLSRGMTYKAAISGLNLGGGKAVIIGDSKKLKNEAFLRRFGRFVDSLSGRYITAEDMNMNTSDMVHLSYETDHVMGLPESMNGSGDPSPVTAYGVYMGMKATVNKAYGIDSLQGKKISVQGVGQVGHYLVDYLIKEGALVTITDINESNIKRVTDKHDVTVVNPEMIYDVDADIYAPCAMGATLNDDTITRIKANVIVGAANNQLKDEVKHGNLLAKKGIYYAPDFLVNAGGIINIFPELMGNYNKELALEQTEKIYDKCTEILNKAEKENITPHQAALEIADKRIADMGKVKLAY
ncbi:Glu/Leu/Phe/Val dehydrogenase [Marivirga sp. S37H4]|uniref:Glu/Leu/Phe/Val dehydrogenase n=1 Tax=Marivirga aurantiaca TaxID=2802615 RepID=A0A935CA40_9BACT|nr:Glu/Leu/Phe/Val dehydrogenase [Marivirga aurantiaca]MBK6266546.1 Glu/Leu/Phe/Val dehydrogenase [Marivirga aurantiaca]